MNYKKRQFIADPIWGQIELFPWETKILNHFVFNRLHDVMQNSCAYLVYPSLKYSRFLHSIGVLHTVTEIFINCMINTENNLLKKIKDEKAIVFSEADEKKVMEKEKMIYERTKCPTEFTLLLAVVRVAGLLHDIGHLPYSHVFEFALKDFLFSKIPENDGENEKEKSEAKKWIDGIIVTSEKNGNSKEIVFNSLVKYHIQLKKQFYPPHKNYPQNNEQPIHEYIRNQFIETLINDLVKDPSDDFLLQKVLEGSQKLWQENKLPICKSMLSGDIDADRADFVHRDGEFSGLYKSSVDFERFFCNYELANCKVPIKNESKAEKIILARPSKRANAEIEKLLWERFLDYKYIAAHHKVHLFDYIMEKLLIECIRRGIFINLIEVLAKKSTGGSQDDKKERLRLETIIKDYFNDSWVNIQLQLLYEKTRKEEDITIKKLYETLTENRTCFISLFKSDEHYNLKKEFESLRRHTIGEKLVISRKCRNEKWEEELEKLTGNIVLISCLDKKIKSGIKKINKDFYSLRSLSYFLNEKMFESRPLNIWYYSENGKIDIEKERKILDFVKTNLEAIKN